MPREHTEDEAFAKLLQCAPEEIAAAREAFSRQHLLRKIIAHDLSRQIETLRTTLETVPEKDLRDLQGQIKGLKSAKGIILKTQP